MADAPVVQATGFTKSFSGRTVLRNVDLAVQRGEVHALVGQNGSGKSTFIKILAGYHAPEPGARLEVRGSPVELPLHPDTPGHLGLAFVHQDLGIFEDGTVLENLLIGQYRTGLAWRIDWRAERRRAAELLAAHDLKVHPDTPLRALSGVERTIVAIVRALARVSGKDDALLVLDEPTARLPRDSVEAFFTTIRRIADRGNGVLFVSHRLDEVVNLADRVSVLRDGELVARLASPELSVPRLVEAIVGGSLERLPPPTPTRASGDGFAVQGLRGGPVEDFSAVVGPGEILGVTGLLGMGHDRVPYLLFGAERATGGTIRLGGSEYPASSATPHDSIARGIALLPGNRGRDGAVGEATARENVTLAALRRFVRHGILRPGEERLRVLELMDRFDVQPRDPEARMSTFSGGNQQKALLAKWLLRGPGVMLLDEPTHGVDVGARRQIMGLLRHAADGGMSILVASVEADDLVQLCRRVLVMRHGRVVAELAGSTLTATRISEQSQLADQAAALAR
jgi:ribose transport system ATP-binding protein